MPSGAPVFLAGILLAAHAAPGPLAAQQRNDSTPVILETLEVTAKRERAAPPPVATVDLTGPVLRHTQSANPYDLIRRAASIEVHEQGQGPGFASDVVVRGFTSDHSADVLLVVDGVPVNLPINGHGEGYADWNSLLPAAVSSLRLINGSGSPLYGDFALAGVVEVFTAADADGSTLSLNGTSQGGVGGWARTGRRTDRGGSLVAVEGRRDEGWRDHSDYWLANTLLRGWKRAGAAGRLEGGLGLYTSGWNSPGFISVAQFNAGHLDRAADRTDGGSSTRLVAHGRYAVPLGTATALETVAWTFASKWNLFLTIPEEGEPPGQTAEHDDRVAVGGQTTLTWTPPAGEFSVGLAGRADAADYALGPSVQRIESAREADDHADYRSGSAYGRWRRTFGGRLGLDLGARVDVVDYRNRDWTAGGRRSGDTHAILAPKIGVRYLLGANLSLLVSFSRGFRGAAGVIGEPTRPPLLAWASEAGIHWRPDPVDVEVSLFRLDVSNERIVDPVTRENTSAGTSVRQGVDLRGSVRIAGATSVQFGGTFNDANLTGEFADAHTEDVLAGLSFLHDEAGQGKRVPGVARYTAHLGISTVFANGMLAGVSGRVLGPYVPIGEPDVRTKAYAVADLNASIPLGGPITADIGLQNLFDRRYPEIRASGFINPGLPRTLRVALNWSSR